MTVSADAESLMRYSAMRYHNCNHLAQNCEKLTKYNQINNHYTEKQGEKCQCWKVFTGGKLSNTATS